MKNLTKTILTLTGVAALSLAYPASVEADVTFRYTGSTFDTVTGQYTTSDFVSGMMTLAAIPSGCPCELHPISFSFTDGVQTLTNTTPGVTSFFGNFFFGAQNAIFSWTVELTTVGGIITTNGSDASSVLDLGATHAPLGQGFTINSEGHWEFVPDAGSTLLLMTLTLMALGLVARRFQRAAG